MDYRAERGAKRNFEPWRDRSKAEETAEETEEQVLDRLEREEGENMEQEERDKMAELEEKMLDSKREMAIADALDEIRTRNARIERGGAGGEVALGAVREEKDEEAERVEREIEEVARRAFRTEEGEKVRRLVEDDESPDNGVGGSGAGEMPPPPPSFARVKKAKKPAVNSLGIKKKAKPSLV